MSATERIYSVDLALATQKPKIELRGKLYALRSTTGRERMELMLEMMSTERKVAQKVTEGETPVEAELQSIEDTQIRTVQGLLEGVSDEVAKKLTEMEFMALQAQIREAHSDLDFTAARGRMKEHKTSK